MARTLTAPGPLDTLEDAFDLLQRAPAPVWLRYSAGAAPLLIGLLLVLNEFSRTMGSDQNPVLAALFLVVLLVWFYRSRQAFSAHLRRILSLTADSGKSPRPNWSLAAFEGTKFLTIPLAIVSIVPLAYTIAFYRSVALYSGQGLSTREATAKAWRACIAWQRENWFMLAIVNLLGVAVLVNVAVSVVVAPMLVKIFTGYENMFTQRGAGALAIQLPVIAALTWLCLDPLLQAVYTVRAFKLEGRRTGEDLLVRLKRLAMLLVVIGVAGLSLSAQTLTRDKLNQSIDRTLQSRDYNWRFPPPAVQADKTDWFIDAVDKIVLILQKTWQLIDDLWSDFLGWLDRQFRNAMPAMDKVHPGHPSAVRSGFYVTGIGIIILALVLLWKFGPRWKKAAPLVAATPAVVDLNNEALLATDLPEDEWLKMAEGYASSGDLRLALRALYLGSLATLNQRGLLTIHACKSNRDYEGELRRRSRDTGLTQIFRLNIRSFEQSWYGFHEVTAEQFQNFRDNLGRIRSHAT